MKRPGLTLIELVVVIAILAVLLALLLPAVQKVRERAAVARSQNQLRQIVFGCHAYDAGHGGRLPGTGLTRDDQGWPVVYFDILPQIEQAEVYAEFTVTGDGVVVAPSAPGTGPRRVIPTYVSPCDATNPDRTDGGYGCASYAPNRSAFGPAAGFARSFPDGTSNTILFGERLMRCKAVPNRWYSLAPEFLVFGAAPPAENFGPAVDDCNPARCCSAYKSGILVGMADGSGRLVSLRDAEASWVTACDPADGEMFAADE